MQPIDLVFWDWNGTLLDDVDYSLGCLNGLLAQYGYPQRYSLEAYREIFGFPIEEYYRRVGFLRDPTENYGRTILFDNTPNKFHDEFSVYYAMSRKIGKFIISLIISIILLDLDIKYVFIFLLFISIITIFITSKITNELQNK